MVRGEGVRACLERALDAGEGILRLAPTWVPRSFLHPGRRLRLHPDHWYAYGAHRGGIDERWLGSTIEAANEGRVWHEGLSFVQFERDRFLLKEAIAEMGPRLIGPAIYQKYQRWPVFAKFFDNMGPIPFHMHQRTADAVLVAQEAKPESYYFPPQFNDVDNNFPYSFMGLIPGTSPADVRRCLENWSLGDNGILNLSTAHRLQLGTGWLIPPGVLHAPGSRCTYEPQWGSDVFAMFESLVEGRTVPWSLLVKDMPADRHQDLDFIVGQLDWDKNVDPNFKRNCYLEPIVAASGDGWVDRWIVYGLIDGQQLFSARELTLQSGVSCQLADPGASSWITIQGTGRIGNLRLQTSGLIRFDEDTDDEVFITHEAATRGVRIENTGAEPLVSLRYFGPNAFKSVPPVGCRPNS
ncbi:MAG TPA: hypothetical protein VGM76_18805 [Lacipirellulaceae bacterium]